MLWCTVVCFGVLWCAVVCCGVLWCALVCCGVLWCAVLCWVRWDHLQNAELQQTDYRVERIWCLCWLLLWQPGLYPVCGDRVQSTVGYCILCLMVLFTVFNTVLYPVFSTVSCVSGLYPVFNTVSCVTVLHPVLQYCILCFSTLSCVTVLYPVF